MPLKIAGLDPKVPNMKGAPFFVRFLLKMDILLPQFKFALYCKSRHLTKQILANHTLYGELGGLKR